MHEFETVRIEKSDLFFEGQLVVGVGLLHSKHVQRNYNYPSMYFILLMFLYDKRANIIVV